MEESGKYYEICIQQDQEHRSLLPPDRINSRSEFFYNAYQDAKYQLREIVMASSKILKGEREELTAKKRIELLREYPNNVIAFCADRGRGKTTAMLSFSNALEALGNSLESSPKKFWENVIDNEQLLDARFEVMAPIDPASMENTDSVLQQILSQMFENFCRRVKCKSRYESGGRDCDRDALSDKFQKCAQAIDSLYKAEKGPDTLIEDELDKIAEIGQSGKLLLLLHELVDKYLEFMQCGEGPKRCLVVQIDDADMDIRRSFQILEDVRKYLGLPRVIVLMATNLQQLETTVEQHFLKEYEQGLKYTDSMITVERCHDIAVLYLEKAIPHPRRIYLPDIGEIIRGHLMQLRVNYQKREDYAERTTEKEGKNLLSEKGTYQEQLLELLHRKTGMVFTFEPDYLHNLLPAHMRELSQFLTFFNPMEDVSDGYEIAVETFRNQAYSSDGEVTQRLNQWEENLTRLEFYLVDLWSAINLREGSRNLFREFVAQPESVRNLYILRNIGDYYVRERIALENTKSTFVRHESDFREEFEYACTLRGIDLKSYLDETVQGEMSVSYADVMGVLAALTDLPGANRQYKFAYAIRLFCSIRLHIALIREIRMIGNGEKSIGFRTLTDLLRDTFLKNGPANDTVRTPFGCWRFEMPIEWFQPIFAENPEEKEIPFLRWKYKADQMIRTRYTITPIGVENVWRPVTTQMGQRDNEVILFNPLYPLLAALDRFIRFENVNMMESDMDKYKAQIYIALLVCLNWDVQRVLFKKIKNQTDENVKKMVHELYSRYIADCVNLIPHGGPSWLCEPIENGSIRAKTCFEALWGDENEQLFDIFTMRVHPEKEFKAYIKNAEEGKNQFVQSSKIFQKLIEKASVSPTITQMNEFWTIADDENNKYLNDEIRINMLSTLCDMDMSVFKALSADVLNKYIKENLPEDDKLTIFISDFFKLRPLSLKKYPKPLMSRRITRFSLKDSSLTPTEVKCALERYIDFLKQILELGFESAEKKFTLKEPVAEKQELSVEKNTNVILQSSVPETLNSIPNLAQVTDSEAAIKTLQSLLQLGQQILNAMTFLQQNSLQGNQQPSPNAPSQKECVDHKK